MRGRLRCVRIDRSGFSLLEVIIATAVMAGSAMVLVSLIDLGSRYGQQAEMRTVALTAAQSILDELVANSEIDRSTQEITGLYGSRNLMSYRLVIRPYNLGQETSGQSIPGLRQATIEIFQGEIKITDLNAKPLCTISRVVRLPSSGAQSPTTSLEEQEEQGAMLLP